MQAIYRVRQGISNLSARPRPEDEAVAAQYLSPTELRLFARMEPADRRHSLGVLRSLEKMGVRDRHILQAALLHDVGKSRRPISIFHRTLAVILRAVFGQIPSFFTWVGRESLWGPFYVLENHPRLSAAILVRAGCEERVWRLAEMHHVDPKIADMAPMDEWTREALRLLRKADSEN